MSNQIDYNNMTLLSRYSVGGTILGGFLASKELFIPAIIVVCISWIIHIIRYTSKEKEKLKFIEEKEIVKKDKINIEKQRDLLTFNNNIKKIESELKKIKTLKVVDVSDYLEKLKQNEKIILEKGGEDKMLIFIKIEQFLNEFNSSINKDLNFLNSEFTNKIKENIQLYNKDTNVVYAKGVDPLINVKLKIEVKNEINKFSKVKFYNSLNSRIKTLNYLKNISIILIIFYTENKMISFYSIYNFFEKLGAFHTSFQKSILSSIEELENHLIKINQELNSINENIINLIDNDSIISELKEIDSKLKVNNLISAITAYQTYKINLNTK